MARCSSRLPINLCLNLIGTRIRFRSATFVESPKIDSHHRIGKTDQVEACCGRELTNKKKQEIKIRKVMVAIDSSREAKDALDWALSNSVQPDDTVVLLDVVKPCTIIGEKSEEGRDPDENRLLHAMKSICQAKRPEVHVELAVEEGKERGPAIVEAARKQGISLLVVSQKKRSVAWRLLTMWAASGGKTVGDTAEYCVKNATCMALAVRRKSKNGGGYLITSKRLKDFWLLA